MDCVRARVHKLTAEDSQSVHMKSVHTFLASPCALPQASANPKEISLSLAIASHGHIAGLIAELALAAVSGNIAVLAKFVIAQSEVFSSMASW